MLHIAYKIFDLQPADENFIEQTAALLVHEFPQAWPGMPIALAEVHESLEPGKLSRIAVGPSDDVLGWIGGIPHYAGNAWELHPLVVRADKRRMGLGSALVSDLETLVRERGAWTLYLGTDDEHDQTSLSGVDLYPNVWEHVVDIRNLSRHPFEFYQRLGFVITGVIPDANGWGKPDIFMAKRLKARQG